MRCKVLFSLGCMILFALLVAPSASQGQFKGGFGGGGFGGPGGPSGGNRDPNQIFDFLSKGRGYFLLSETRSLREPLSQYFREKGINGDQVTRETFATFNEYMKTKTGGMTPPGGPGSKGSRFGGGFTPPGDMRQGGPGGPGPSGFSGGMNAPGMGNPADSMNQWADAEFKRRDMNGDGFLNMTEMSDQLKADLGKWDNNRDNLVNQDEFKNFFASRFMSRREGGDQGPVNPVTILLEDEDLDRKPVVFRAGKLPKDGMPKWFLELDTDKDGQVGLYEWRKGGKDLADFRDWDRNNDGLVTIEEALNKQRAVLLASSSEKDEEGGDRPEGKSRFGKGGPGGPGFGGFGKGAPGMGERTSGEESGKGNKGNKGNFKFQFKRPQ